MGRHNTTLLAIHQFLPCLNELFWVTPPSGTTEPCPYDKELEYIAKATLFCTGGTIPLYLCSTPESIDLLALAIQLHN